MKRGKIYSVTTLGLLRWYQIHYLSLSGSFASRRRTVLAALSSTVVGAKVGARVGEGIGRGEGGLVGAGVGLVVGANASWCSVLIPLVR